MGGRLDESASGFLAQRGNLSPSDSDRLRFLLIFDSWDPWARGGTFGSGK